jgi:hypothetical protein
MKPGFKTSELVGVMLVHILAGLQLFLMPGGTVEKVVALVVMALNQLGYTAGRSIVKANEQKSIAAQALGKANVPSL